jgi:polysaccharide export outer membrane protein
MASMVRAVRAGRQVFVWTILLGALLAPADLRSQAPAPPPGGEGADAPILPGDVVRLRVWREPDLSSDFPVNQFGTVVLPKLGEYDVRGETHRSFRERVIRDLRKTIENPSIEVVVLKRVRVLGEVMQAGVFHLDPTETVADALARAQGTSPNAQRGVVLLRRNGEVVFANLRVETSITDSRIRSGDELFVPERSWLARNATAVLGSSAAFLGVVVALMTR